jgi:hypothetical protein
MACLEPERLLWDDQVASMSGAMPWHTLAGFSRIISRGQVTGQMLRYACHAPVVWNRRPMRKPIAAAPRPIITICSPFLRQSPARVTAW